MSRTDRIQLSDKGGRTVRWCPEIGSARLNCKNTIKASRSTGHIQVLSFIRVHCSPPRFCCYLPAVTFTSGCRQLPGWRGPGWDSHAAAACMSDWRVALQLLAFKEHPPGPPVTVLLNKHGTAHRHQWEQMKSPPQERDPITWLVVHLLCEFGSVYRFEVSYFDCNL